MSTPGPCGRETPRGSVAGAPVAEPASIAGLPGSNVIVSVGPPLLASGPSMGFMFVRLPVPVKTQLASELRLCPASVIVPDQFAGLLLASSVLAKTHPIVLTPPTAVPLVPTLPVGPSG